MVRFLGILTIAGLLALGLSACGGNSSADEVRQRYQPINTEEAGRIGVNGYLWRAALDTLAFMPMKSSDSAGGVIATDWYVNPDVPDERMSVTAYIKDQRLRADALQVTVHRQIFKEDRGWVDEPVQAETAQKLENAILARARELRLGTIVNN